MKRPLLLVPLAACAALAFAATAAANYPHGEPGEKEPPPETRETNPQRTPFPLDEPFLIGLAWGAGGVGGLGLAHVLYRAPWPRRLTAIALWPGFARLARRDVDEHPLRARILLEIRQSPGLSTSDLAGRTDANVGTLEYHLTILRRAGRIRMSRAGRDRIYFLSDVPADEAAAAALAARGRREVANLVLAEPGLHAAAIAKRLELRPATVLHHVAALELVGLLRVERGLRTRCWPTGRLQAAPAQPRRLALAFDEAQRNA